MKLKLFIAIYFFTLLPFYTYSTENQLAEDNDAFALSLYQTLSSDSDANVIFSPYSIFSCLSMAALGASGDTALEMRQSLHLSINSDILPMVFATLNHTLNSNNSLHIANALWADQDTSILPSYSTRIAEAFDGNIQSLDFSEPVKASSIINEWISNETNGNIPSLLMSGDITADTRVVLTNAVYFKGSWAMPFKAQFTAQAPFWVRPDLSKNVSMMHQTAFFDFFQNEEVQVAAFPFIKESITCLIVLPQNNLALDDVFSDLHPSTLHFWMSKLASTRLDVFLPKFKLKQRFSLKPTLQKLGMRLAFSDHADFSKIDGLKDLMISTVIHEALFDLDEAGVTAAAATATGMTTTSYTSEPPVVFRADHPFLFFLIDQKTETLLFMGKVVQLGN